MYWEKAVRFGWDLSQNKPTAGEYQAIGLDLQGSSPEYAAKLQGELEATKTKLESGDEAQVADLTKQQLVGDMLESTIFSYFAMNNLQDDIAAQQAGIVNYRLPSYGKFSTSLTTSYWFGTPRNVSASGLAMDVDRVFNNKVDKDNNLQNRINFNQLTGNRLSAMEHLIPEQMFSIEEAPAQGISAVKAIALASAQGQKIWTITQDNLDAALAAINLDADSEAEIRNSVNAGSVVTTHEQSINFNGWIGEGYIIVDPQTGAGAYKIAGGGNGSRMGLGDAYGDGVKGLTWAGWIAQGLGKLTSSRFFMGLGGVVLAPMANAISILANGFMAVDKCLRAGVGGIKAFAVGIWIIALTALFVKYLAALGPIFTVGPLSFMFFGMLEGIKSMIGSAIKSLGC